MTNLPAFHRMRDIIIIICNSYNAVGLCTHREGIGASPSLFYNIPCRENIESLIQHHLAAASYSNNSSTRNFCLDLDFDEAFKAQLCAAQRNTGTAVTRMLAISFNLMFLITKII